MVVKWALRVFREDNLIVDRELSGFGDERARAFLGRSPNEDVYGCYPLSAERLAELCRSAGVDLGELHLKAGDVAYLEDYQDA